MNDETRSDNDAEDAENSGPRGGQRLREAREEQQIALLEIAKELHLDEHKVRALEQNEFDILGAPVFAKGHLRKYAELVGVDERDILGDYHELTRASGMPPVVGKRRKTGSEVSPGPWIVVALVLLALAFAYWWFSARNAGPESAALTAPGSEPASEVSNASGPNASGDNPIGESTDTAVDAAAGMDLPDEVSGDSSTDVPAASDSPAEQDGETAADSAASNAASGPVAAPGRVRLGLSFGEDCWTEVSDASGQRLFFGLGRAGTSIEVEGAEPLSVLLGSADQVEVSLNGDEYSIRPEERRGRTARLTLP
ncbi:MAG: RodZ domain-containing protein [Pseudomonadota bacterium]